MPDRLSRTEFEDKILRVAHRIAERREAQAFAEAFVRAPKWMQDELRAEWNQPSPILQMFAGLPYDKQPKGGRDV